MALPTGAHFAAAQDSFCLLFTALNRIYGECNLQDRISHTLWQTMSFTAQSTFTESHSNESKMRSLISVVFWRTNRIHWPLSLASSWAREDVVEERRSQGGILCRAQFGIPSLLWINSNQPVSPISSAPALIIRLIIYSAGAFTSHLQTSIAEGTWN